MINSSKYLKFVLYYQIISFYFLGIFYRLSTFNQYLYVIADIVFISVYLLIFERKIAYTNIKLFIIFILFYLFGSFQGYDSGGAFIIFLLIYLKYILFKFIIINIPQSNLIRAFTNIGILNTVILLAEVLSHGHINLFVNHYTLAQKIETLNKVGTNLAVLRGGFENPLVTSVMLSSTLLFFMTIEKALLRNILIMSNLFLIMATEKRTGILISIALLFCYYFRKNLKTKSVSKFIIKFLGFALLAINMITISGRSISQMIIERFSSLSSGSDFSAIHRSMAFKIGIEIIWSRNILNILFGNGFYFLPTFMYNNNITITKLGFLVIDNSYLSFLADFGMMPLISIMFYLIGGIFKNLVSNETDNISEVVMFSLIALLLSASVFDILNWYQSTLLTCFFVAYLSVYHDSSKRKGNK
ncbi:Uncharacterised protein [Streptococcus pneumoniae]|uniref:hypothetical protein n=1 Tax=Streptococcus pneumoniae TaxID=1313 RepID=UPI0007656619|nr:hypothetical protein [Streptococcus pneumoniae]CVU19701.1 Uncharacterised protein [Streptococcus pneumoniae]CWB30142.1 Uncharacterised protein [Streptococcus pneumoniae]HEW5086247.1 hypothetical protein [Streptococcus pneumoniae]HEW8909775.1 hypothetical protein [Streptococcus pneumoniae]